MKHIELYSRTQPGRNARLLLLMVVLLFGAMLINACGSANESAAYSDKVKFKKGSVLQFPDFDLIYLGERKVVSPVFKPGFIYHDFSAIKNGSTVTVSWSSGTGEIAPQWFEIDGKKLQLELRYSDRLGRLKDDELVVSKR